MSHVSGTRRAPSPPIASLRWIALAATLLAALAASSAFPNPASAGNRTLEIGFADRVYMTKKRDLWLDKTVRTGAEHVRILMSWRSIAPKPPGNPRNPADPKYNFTRYDEAIIGARSRGMSVMVTVNSIPEWAEGPGRSGSESPGSWKPRPSDMADFLVALSQRYSGSYMGLPRVGAVQLLNEANLGIYLSPQLRGGKLIGAIHYRRLSAIAHRELKRVGSHLKLVASGLAPYGNPSNGRSTRPLRFWREVFCLKDRKRLSKANCPAPERRAHFDVMAHHPINTSGPPRQSAFHPDDASSPDMDKIRRITRRAEKTGRLRPKGTRPIWVTETWWESRPPDKVSGVPLRTHARYIAESIYLFWKGGASRVYSLRVRDGVYTPETHWQRDSTGAFFFKGKAKPALRAFQFPFVVAKKGRPNVKVWGRAPAPGPVVIERKVGRRWVKAGTLLANSARIFEGNVTRGKGRQFRAISGASKSLAWDL